MHYNLLFNGCSYTNGFELEGPDNDIEYRRVNRYSHLVAEHFRITYDNISLSGASNDWISKRTIEWFNRGNACDVAIIQFTRRNRLLIYNENNNEINISPRQLNHTDSIHFSTIEKIKAYYKFIHTEYTAQENYYKNIFLLYDFLKNRNIKVIFLTIEHENNLNILSGWKDYCKDIEIKEIQGDIIPKFGKDDNFYCKNYELMYNTTKDKKYALKFGTHPNEIGHQKIADFIISKIDTK